MEFKYKYPELKHVILKKIHGERLKPFDNNWNFTLSKEIELSFIAISEQENILLAKVDISGDLENKENENIFNISAQYQVYFEFIDKDATKDLILNQLENSDYQYTIIAQAYSVSVQKFLISISDFGINATKINHQLIPNKLDEKGQTKEEG